MRAPRSGLLAGTILVIAALVAVIPAAAATTTAWASWQPLVGGAGAYTTTVSIAAQPDVVATVTSDSRSGQVGVISGASTWLGEGTPVGAKYGSSRDQPYLNLRPKADNATSPSTTTYSFDAPTPASGWTFVLGDIDADAVRIHALAADGHVLDATELGFRSGFNYCAPGVVGAPSCTGDAADVPTWDPATLTLTGNPAATDTSGAAAWFEPSTPLVSLSFVFTRRAGFPVYQTWFASISRDITGSVVDMVDGPLDGVAVTLFDRDGRVVDTTTTTGGGGYAFPGVVATDGYTVRVSPPDGKIAESAGTVSVDLTDADGVADFTVRDVEPVPVSGRVTDTDGRPIAGVVVTIDGRPTTTDADGRYYFDRVPDGDHTAVITLPDGYTLVTAPPPFTVPVGSEVPITGVDFRLSEQPALSGTVRAAGSGIGIAGVTVTVTGPGGTSLSTVTDGGGAYRFLRLPAGDYRVEIEVPSGHAASGPTVREESIAAADVEDVDFELTRLGAIGGQVRDDDGAPRRGVTITVDGPGGRQQLTTDADGAYGLGALAPGTYTVAVSAPTGSTVVGSAVRTVVIGDTGDVVSEQDFVLADVVVSPTPSAPPASGGGQLPATGLAPETFLWAGLGAGVLILGGVVFALSRRRSRRD
ncbi:carboxypeptidase regulatory-like domain-containing protein [Streptomyces sp. AC495_CC817]|uniref:carboxypeptidase regulatory-like domain-containing protein n=1 Tax=Streptomyces sp. AC495_CC817 TaxID=2823900 RepID=UPI001C26E98D|nr:carboxypeptidase regulatory-like domain-containing protein [Streptomyces sp. AC495_CC817]